MVSQTKADPGYPPGLVPCLGRLPDGEIFAALVWSNKLSVNDSWAASWFGPIRSMQTQAL